MKLILHDNACMRLVRFENKRGDVNGRRALERNNSRALTCHVEHERMVIYRQWNV